MLRWQSLRTLKAKTTHLALTAKCRTQARCAKPEALQKGVKKKRARTITTLVKVNKDTNAKLTREDQVIYSKKINEI